MAQTSPMSELAHMRESRRRSVKWLRSERREAAEGDRRGRGRKKGHKLSHEGVAGVLRVAGIA